MKSLVFVLALLPAIALASDWMVVGEGEDEAYLVDRQSIIVQGKYLKAWALTKYHEQKMDGGRHPKVFQSRKTLMRFDCEDRTISISATIDYEDGHGKGKVVKSSEFPFNDTKFASVAPDSIGEAQLNTVCSLAIADGLTINK